MMRLDFDPADPEEHQSFLEARNELVARFERSAGGAGLGHVAEQVLDFKFGYLDGDLGDWDDEDVEVVLLDLYPAKALLDEEDLGEVVAGFAALLRFLAGEGLLAAGAAEGERLARGVDVLEPRFRAAMADESLWAPGKRILAAMRAEGVDPTDRDATDRWISDFNALPIEARDAVLGPLPGGPPRGGRDVGVRLPPVTLPPIDELAAAAAGSVQLRRLVRLVEFVGEGRPLTDRGNLKLADGKALVELLGTGDRVDEQIGDRVFRTRSSGELTGVDLTFRVAVESGVLAVEGRKVVPGPNAHRLADEPHEALYGAWLALVHGVGPTRHHFRRHRYHFDWYAEVLDESLPTMQLDLYREGAPVDIEELADEAWDRIEEQFDLDRVSEARRDQERESVGYSLRKALDRLEELGIVSLAGVVEVTTPYGFTRAAGGTAALTPLGRWAVHRLVSRFAEAPVVGDLRDVPAGELLERTADRPEAEATAEIDAWVDHQGERAADLLVGALPDVGETARGLGFRALLRMGPAAAGAVARLDEDPSLSPYATVWRVDALLADADEMDSGGDPERFVRLLHAVLDLWGPDALTAWLTPAAGATGEGGMLDAAWRVRRPETEAVLAAIGGHHPDKAVAKAARKALFKHRSSTS